MRSSTNGCMSCRYSAKLEEVRSLEGTDRGKGGFGSTGIQ